MTDKEHGVKESESFIGNGENGEYKPKEKDNYSRVPIDRGWAWAVLFGGVFSMAIVIGCYRTNGIFFVEFQRVFKSSSTVTSIITTLNNIVFCISSPLIMTIGIKSLKCRYIVLAGSILLCVSYVVSGVAKNITIVMIAQGAIQGFAIACVEPTSMSTVTKYFKKRRDLSNSLVSAGNAMGGLIFPPLVTKLFDAFGYMGCMLIIGAINLNVCISAMLYRPLDFYKVQHKRINENPKKKGKKSIAKMLRQLLLILDFKLFRNPLFVIFQIGFGMFTSASILSMMYIPSTAKENGVTDENAAFLVTIFSGVDLFGRVLYGVLADTNKFNRTTLVAVSGVIFGTTTLCVRFYTTFELLVMHVVIIGATSGALKSLYPGIIVEYLSLKNLDSTIGFAMLTLGLTNGIFIFIGGYLMDVTGSFVATFYLGGVLAFIGVITMIALPCLQRLSKQSTQDIDERDVISYR